MLEVELNTVEVTDYVKCVGTVGKHETSTEYCTLLTLILNLNYKLSIRHFSVYPAVNVNNCTSVQQKTVYLIISYLGIILNI